jgi:hypothetical protein
MRLALALVASLALAGPAAAGDVYVHLSFVPGALRVSAAPAVTSIAATCAAGSTCTLPRFAAGPSGATVLRRGTARLPCELARRV